MRPVRRRHDPRRPGLVPVQGRRRPGDLRRQGVEPAPAAVELLPGPARPAPAHRADGGDGRDGRVDPGAQRGRGADARVQPHQAAPARGSTSACATTRATRSSPSPLDERVAAGDGDAGPQAQGRRATSARTATPTPSARRSTCCCARFPIRTCSPTTSSTSHQRLGRPCLLFHIEKCAGPCVGEIDEDDYDELVDELCDFLDGDTDADRQAARAREMRDGGRRARVRAGGPAARPADRGAQGDREAADGGRAQTRTST